MKSYIQLANIANIYYDIWTDDGIDAFHADENEIAAWLKNEDLRTEADSALEDLTDEEIEKVASMIADIVADKLKNESDSDDLAATVSAVVKETAALFDFLKDEPNERS